MGLTASVPESPVPAFPKQKLLQVPQQFTVRPMAFQAAHLPAVSPTVGSIFQSVKKFVEADDLLEILEAFQGWKNACIELERMAAASAAEPSTPNGGKNDTAQLDGNLINPITPFDVYSLLRKHTVHGTHHLKDFWACIEARFADARHQYHSELSSPSVERRVLVAGAGPGGLRAAIEMCLLKCEHVVVLEKRDTFSRVNVMRIHAEDMDELVKGYGARDFYRKISLQERDVIAIRRLQIVLAKIALCLGAEIYAGAEFTTLKSDPSTPYWTAPTVGIHSPSPLQFNILILASGEKSTLPSQFSFSRSNFRAGTATGVTCNFVPSHAPMANADAMEGGRVSYLNAPFFKKLKNQGLELENFASYTTEESHYLVMTPKKTTLLERGVLKEDNVDPVELVRPENVERTKLERFARDVATAVGIPPENDFLPMRSSKNGATWPDVAIFDFTGKTMATEPSKMIIEEWKGGRKSLLVALVGDALVEPFWPMGTGWARAVGSCKLLGDAVRELGKDPGHWADTAETVMKMHEEGYVKLKSASYAPMTNVMGSA